MSDPIVLKLPADPLRIVSRGGESFRIVITGPESVSGLAGEPLSGTSCQLRLPDVRIRHGSLDAQLPRGRLLLRQQPAEPLLPGLDWRPQVRRRRVLGAEAETSPQLLDLQTFPAPLRSGQSAWLCAHFREASGEVRFELGVEDGVRSQVEAPVRNGWARVRWTPNRAGPVACELRCGSRRWRRTLRCLQGGLDD